jgi:hypothetical protein
MRRLSGSRPSHPVSSRTSSRGGLQLVPRIGQSRQNFREGPNARSPRNLLISGGLFHGRQPAETLFAQLLRGDALRPLTKKGGWMPTCQSEKSFFIAFFSRTGVLGRAMWPPGSHPAFCLLFRKTAGRSKEWQIAKIRDFRRKILSCRKLVNF